MIKKLFKSEKIGLYAMLGCSLFFEITSSYHNAIVSYFLCMQIMVLFLCIQFLLIDNYNEYNKKTALFLLGFVQTITILSYEIGYVFLIIAFLYAISFKKEKNYYINIFTETFIVGILNSIVLLYVKIFLRGNDVYNGIKIEFDVVGILKALYWQTVGAFPLSNYLSVNKMSMIDIFKASTIWDYCMIVFFVILCVIIDKCLTKSSGEDAFQIRHIHWLALFAVAFWVLPGSLSCLTPKYQHEVRGGGMLTLVFIFNILVCGHVFLWLIIFGKE